MRLRTFIIAGAPRGGTTYLYDVLQEHPQVYMAKPRVPEPKFFLVDDEYRQARKYSSRKYFAAVGEARAVGEKSANYLESAAAASRIRESLPDVKLVFALRAPVARGCCYYLWSRKTALETLSCEQAIEQEATRAAHYPPQQRFSRPFSYISRGMYAELLRPYFALFPREQLRVMCLEEIEQRPKPTLDELCRFLGVDPLPSGARLSQRINSAREGNEQLTAA